MDRVPLVSVVIPSFNSERYIRQTLASVQNQTFGDWELIVVDDYSTDASPAIVEEHARQDERIRLIRLARNAGRPAIPRNVGVQSARGAYVAFLDADDLWHPQKLATQIGFMREQGVRFTSTGTHSFRDEAEISPSLALPAKAPDAVIEIDHRRLLRKNVIPTSSVVAERTLLVSHPFIEDLRYKAIEDYHCWLTIHQHEIGCSCKFSSPLVFYRLTESSISKSKAAMFRKNYMLYSEYRIRGEPLGMRKFLYLGTYMCLSLADRFGRIIS